MSEFDGVINANTPQEAAQQMQALAGIYGVSLESMIALFNQTVGHPTYADVLRGQ